MKVVKSIKDIEENLDFYATLVTIPIPLSKVVKYRRKGHRRNYIRERS
jgi:hypothetical protein